MPYDDFEAMLYSEVPEKQVPSRPQEKPVERFTPSGNWKMKNDLFERFYLQSPADMQ